MHECHLAQPQQNILWWKGGGGGIQDGGAPLLAHTLFRINRFLRDKWFPKQTYTGYVLTVV